MEKVWEESFKRRWPSGSREALLKVFRLASSDILLGGVDLPGTQVIAKYLF